MTVTLGTLRERRSIAVVSGKGGSGKTMVAATLARLFDEQGKLLLIDADFGTAGLSYYLGLTTVPNISVGLTNLEDNPNLELSVDEYAQRMHGFVKARFLAVGDHKRHLSRAMPYEKVASFFRKLIESRRLEDDIILVDCRGGIDTDSLAVCEAVDTILIVVETDTTSFQATQHLVEVLHENALSQKVAGFIINKVFDDPSTIARAGTASFKAQYLGSIPFDLEATKSFLLGELPSRNGMFASQVWHAIFRILPDRVRPPSTSPLSLSDFRSLSIRDNNSVLGGMFLSILSLGLGSVLILQALGLTELTRLVDSLLLQLLVLVAVISGIEPIRRMFGRAFQVYVSAFSRLFSGRSK